MHFYILLMFYLAQVSEKMLTFAGEILRSCSRSAIDASIIALA